MSRPVTTTYVALLRAVNVAGRKVPMADLRRSLDGTAFGPVRTYIQSGNVLFDGPDRSAGALSRKLSRHLEVDLGLATTVVLRSAAQLASVVAATPFTDVDPATVHVTFLAEAPDPARTSAFEPPAGVTDGWSIGTTQVYLHCPDGYGRTKLTNGLFERRLGVPATTRNWRTVVTLAEMAGALPGHLG